MSFNVTLSDKMLLSGSRRVYKTEGFISATQKTASIDVFLSKTAESVFYAGVISYSDRLYMAETEDKLFTLFFRTGITDTRLNKGDIVFYRYLSARRAESGVDRSLSEYLLSHDKITLNVKEVSDEKTDDDFSKIYLVSSGDGKMNFPLLSETQRQIVEKENANMLVQGVAGSGKTNVCVEKIVYCACRNYRGKILYTTYSRALLTETKNRVGLFLNNVEAFLDSYENGNVIFLDENHKKAVENKLGILFDTDDDGKIVDSLKKISSYLKNKVDYFLIEDLYETRFSKKQVADERFFMREYLPKSRLSGALEKIKNVAPEIVYKEIFGIIFGKYNPEAPADMMTKEEYAEERKESFSAQECDIIYSVAMDYAAFLNKNSLTDNNLMSRELLKITDSPLYSVTIIDEAQDFTQVNLFLMKKLGRKLFCVGDALQMINPAYFNFGYVKRIMYGDATGISELTHNYRSSERIESIAEALGDLNRKRFGTHSFVLRGQSVRSPAHSAAVFVKDGDFYRHLEDKRYENATVIVASQRKKELLRRFLGKTEILTVSEAKGLERNTVVLIDVLSDNIDKWNSLKTLSLNRKTADENSVYRYYFNLFYVGISRAKQYLFVAEKEYPELFNSLIFDNFDVKNRAEALVLLKEAAGKIELDDEELTERIEKFCSLEQYENARNAADRLSSDNLRKKKLIYISVHEKYLRFGKIREAGVEYWKHGMDDEAREMFIQSGDRELLPLIDACKNGGGTLDVNIVRFYPLVAENETARNLILDTLKNDYNEIMGIQKSINENLKTKRRKQ